MIATSCGGNREKHPEIDETRKQEILQKGGEIAQLTQGELLKNVSHAMQTGGPGYAIDFCHLRALSIKDSLSEKHQCQIRRISSKYRNPDDKPRTRTEIDQLKKFENALNAGENLEPAVYAFDDRIEYYQPIVINNGACLICHGDPGTQIAEETLQMIRERYPDDLATGFALKDLRGAWQITFEN